jgi:hypothetical protein
MERRNFLKLSALCSLTLAAPFLNKPGHAGVPGYGGPFWLLVHASGEWDPRFLFDPVANGDQNHFYSASDAVGNIPFADYAVDLAAFALDTTMGYETVLLSPRNFLTKYGPRITVVNGIDTSTNNHEAGTRAIWSGRLLGEYPAFGAVVAAAKAKDQPIPFISAGGYDVTDHLVPLARAGSPDVLTKIAYPHLINPTDAKPDHYHTDDTVARIQATRAARLEALRKGSTLTRERASMDELVHARVASGDLARLKLPAKLMEIAGSQLDDLERMNRGTQIALAAFQSGVAAAASISLGGFDTHGNHDRDQPKQITKLLSGLDYIFAQADAAGLGNSLYVVVGSDFGRGPTYNATTAGAGKDHWPVTSMIVWGPNIPGNRVVGATDPDLQALKVDPVTLAPSGNGVTLTPEIVHTALRNVAGVGDAEMKYPLSAQRLPIFG